MNNTLPGARGPFLCALLFWVASGVVGQVSDATFVVTTTFDGLTSPTVVRFANDGRVFVAEKAGIVKVFEGLDDDSPEVVVDLRENVNSLFDRGLLGLALDFDFEKRPFVYVLYTYDAPPGGTAPTWNDRCPTPPGANADGCVVSARLSRFEVGEQPTMVVGDEQVLLENNWCQQFPNHSIGTVAFGSDGALYVGAGEGANSSFGNGDFGGADFGQLGGSLAGTPTPVNPCGDPSGSSDETPTLPDAEGGALRSQDLLTSGDPVGFDGAILRLDPDTGEALPNNPLFGGPVADDDRIIAFGLRNPFRFFVHPTTNEIWIGDVGWSLWEEVNHIASPTDSVVENFGWPCYEGGAPQPIYDGLDLSLCESLYADPLAAEPPFFAYLHGAVPDPDRCGTGNNSALSGITSYLGGKYPPEFDGALLFADAPRSCIWAMLPDTNGQPDPGKISTLVASAGRPVHLEIGPDGDLFYVDIGVGEIRRVRFIEVLIFADGFESGDQQAWQ